MPACPSTPLRDSNDGAAPVLRAEDTLDQALDLMRTNRIHRIYVRKNGSRQAAGVLAYPDIVGLLYRYCNKCEHSLRLRAGAGKSLPDQLRTREVMTAEIYAHQENDSLQKVMEGLAAYRFGAVLIKTAGGLPAGGGFQNRSDRGL